MGFNLVRTDAAVEVSGLIDEAARRALPLTVIDVDYPQIRQVYERSLTRVRPDLMVA